MKKHNRVEFRASQEERQQIAKAANSLGLSISAFLRMVALERSTAIIRDHKTILLSDRNRDLFLEALENPPISNRNLQKAFQAYVSLSKTNNYSNH